MITILFILAWLIAGSAVYSDYHNQHLTTPKVLTDHNLDWLWYFGMLVAWPVLSVQLWSWYFAVFKAHIQELLK